MASFAVSGLASNWLRLGKPFNPLLGETYQLEGQDFRLVLVLVSMYTWTSFYTIQIIRYRFFECLFPSLIDRRIICEQVSHHPPISAFHAESPAFRFYGDINPKIKFWGKNVEIQPKGIFTVELPK